MSKQPHHQRLIRQIRLLRLQGASRTLIAGRLGRKLGEWTGMRWIVSVSRTQGRPTLHEEREANRHQMVSDAKAEPTVAALLSAFPGAKVVDVRVAALEDEAAGLDAPGLDTDPGEDDIDPDF